jgi:hypothetical protein
VDWGGVGTLGGEEKVVCQDDSSIIDP